MGYYLRGMSSEDEKKLRGEITSEIYKLPLDNNKEPDLDYAVSLAVDRIIEIFKEQSEPK